jgi:hypothetical protein
MSKYAWIINEDTNGTGPEGTNMNAVGMLGPRDITPEQEAQLKDGAGEEFKMYDDDGIHYYTGRIIGDYSGFEPLDDYGMPNAGAVDIRYGGKSI